MSDEDERLAAWLDGALSAEETEAFAAELEANPALAAKAEAWQANDRALAGAFFANERPIDDELLARLGLAAAAPVAANDNPRSARFGWLSAGSAIAASVAAALFFTLRPPAPIDDLSGALDRTASLVTAQLADGRKVTPTLTVRAADGRWCREFRDGADNALACRGAAGSWKVEARTRAGEAQDSGTIAVASGADPAPLESAYAKLGAADPVGAADEQALIAKGWK
ncbi:hypothetical protein [Novosphingobium sp. PASSN1]|uniref:hypothetical protein n=1 Tax=Novosphingobium sp. PASSN1 TaxID=2015561 RepID=UPI000BDB7553|nr:hypothetical protein [Novosphingobium sp. PASSN1]OYU37065.1 MAG: hypothetical protein CFE35_01405 [Novosphingobium sp. PASSN1]